MRIYAEQLIIRQIKTSYSLLALFVKEGNKMDGFQLFDNLTACKLIAEIMRMFYICSFYSHIGRLCAYR